MAEARGRMTDWASLAVHERDDLTRRLLFAPSGEREVFTSVYRTPERIFGGLVCPAWGYEGMTFGPAQHELAVGLARSGGAGVAFDYPGQGESSGGAERATMDNMVGAAVDVAYATASQTAGRWVVVGIRVGAAVAVLASAALDPAAVLLIEPELDPERHFAGALRRSHRANLGAPEAAGLAFGFPVPPALVDERHTAAVRSVLAALTCPVAGVRFAEAVTPRSELDDAVEAITVPGRLDRWAVRVPALIQAGLEWVARTVGPA